MGEDRIRVAVLYPADPAGAVIGGIESFIRGLIKAAPSRIEYNIFGATTDPIARPVGRWTECALGSASFRYFPLCRLPLAQKRTLVPATLKHMLQAEIRLPDLDAFDIIESHRIEHFISARHCTRPRNLFLHNTMDIVHNKASDIRWKLAPGLYFRMERRIISGVDSIFIVREEGAKAYREKYPAKRDSIEFIPTVVDADLFRPLSPQERALRRAQLVSDLAIPGDSLLLVFVGRLDSSKDPMLLLDAFARLARVRPNVTLLMVGDGVLRKRLEETADSLGLLDGIRFLGFKSSPEVAALLQVSDMYLLTSAYEGMPIALTEAMSCGLPAVTTDVGEVRKLVRPGVNGEVAASRSPDEFAALMNTVCANLERYRGGPCLAAAEPYTPRKVFQRVYERYEQLHARDWGLKGRPA